jgi:alkanesulfonate monooxygenase SsuD/methylene tetrahydromethanopterin reductase-like flavin-dependent oxidoreductase (luciferase family)
MRVGVSLLPEQLWAEDRRRWQRVEEYGFDHAWTFDHLAWRSLADSPWFATIPTLVAAALSTTTLRLGTWVTSPNFRHPVPLAKELMTLDSISGGRLNIGVGSGGPGWDAAMLGQSPLTPGQRSRRFGEFVTLLDLLLRQRHTTWEGEWFTAVDARNIPGPVQQPRPPLIVAANGPKGMHLALTRGDAWATLGVAERGAEPEAWWAGAREAIERFEQAAADLPTPPPAMPRYLNIEALSSVMTSVGAFRDYVGRAESLGYTDVVIAWPRADGPFAGDERLLDDIADELPALR